jgi:predicted outer membrane repeat protein
MGSRSLRGRVAAGLVGLVLVAGSLVAIGVAPAGATTVTDEASFRTAWTNGSTTQIDLANDVTFTTPCTSAATRASGTGMTVNGNGHTLTLCDDAVNGVLQDSSGEALTFENVTVQGGTATTGNGGAINAPSSAVTVTNSTFTNNTAPGGPSNGGAIDGGGVMTVTNSRFTNNSVGDLGGGGAIYDVGAVTVTNSTFTNNTASEFAGGGAIYDGAVGDGGVTVTNSTFTNNSAGADSIGGGAIFAVGAVTVAYGTLTGNAASRGSAAVSNTSIKSFGSVFVKPAGTGNLCNTGTSDGYNYANETANSCGLTGTGDSSLGANDPLLGALAANGGPTLTQLPQTGSPLIDAIPSAACQTAPLATGITTDQRGLARPSPPGGACDIGAVEVQVTPPAFAGPTALVVTAEFTG